MYKLDKALYGLKQAPRAWYDHLSCFHLIHGYLRGKIDNTLLLRKQGKDLLIFQVYVDDIIFWGTDAELGVEFAQPMSSEFEMSMVGELNFFLGLQIKKSSSSTSIHQQKYIKDLLKKFDMNETKTNDTPIGMETKLDTDETGSPVNDTKYRGMIGSLLCLTASRPDIVFSVSPCASFQYFPKETRLKALKRAL